MKYLTPVFLLIIFLGSVSAQNFKGSLNPFPENQKFISQEDTLRILAIMVSFQEDRDGTTFGNGKFESIYTQNYGNDILDPLPHNKEYFESHLLFVKNYFNKVSKGKLSVEFTILPDTFSVSQVMRNYSPPPGDNDFTPIADFSTEAWTLADQMYPGFPFSDYDVFLVFHAGVGRDVSLPGSIGNERDLPSVYLSERAFKNIYGESFPGIPVSGGSFYIKNSMIIPETESREVQTITGTFLFELTINGLLCASIASHLGLPDLFDTETGLSAIGRFGLMDGQGIFAYNGCFPPEPSPWSKIYLGWIDPVTLDISSGEINISLVTEIASAIGDTSVLKIPINSSEYFLVENRIRDANDDGSIVTSVINGSTIIKTFPKDTTGFYSFDTDSLSGVITDVDEFDWALPGNGIVIWHIDENVINEKIAENKINTDKNRRGVDVEEADGIQDIGERFITIFGDVVIGEGTDQDFWYASNPAELFQNRFAKDTRPDTRTNNGANSLITVKDFSAISNRMNFKVEFGDSLVKPLFTINLLQQIIPEFISASEFAGNTYLNVGDESNSLFIFQSDSLIEQLNNFSSLKSAFLVNNNIFHSYGNNESTLSFRLTDNQNTFFGEINVGNKITAPLVVRTNSVGEHELLIGTENGSIEIYSLANLPNSDPVQVSSLNTDTTYLIKRIASNGNYIAVLAESKILGPQGLLLTHFIDSEGTDYQFTEEIPTALEVTKNANGDYISIVFTNVQNFYIFKSGILNLQFHISGDKVDSTFSLTDLKRDGSNYIVINNGNNIEAYNLTGAMADNFPFKDPEGIGFSGTPLTADFEGDNNSEIISVTKDGRIYAIDGGTGKVVTGFPISCGGGVSVTPVLFNANGKSNLAVLNNQNVLTAWSISSVEGKLYWSEEYGNPQNSSFINAAENTNRINEFFPSKRAYNYPNPVYGGTTQIRYFVSEDSKINIKIFDLAGDYVAELNDDAQGGMDNETVWNVGNIQSGVYLARIEATGNSGKTEEVIIKIAVVK